MYLVQSKVSEALLPIKWLRINKMRKSELIERKFREGKLTKRQYDKMLAHCEHHTLKHVRAMLGSLEAGTSFKKVQKMCRIA